MPNLPVPRGYANRMRRRQKRRKQVTALAILLGLVIVLFLLALWLGNVVQPQSSSISVSSVPSSVSVSSLPESKSVFTPPVVGPYDEEGIPLLLRADRLLPDDFTVELTDVGGGWRLQSDAAVAYLAMKEAAAKDGITLTPVSAYRSHEKQTSNYNRAIQEELAKGATQEEALARTQAFYAIPGTSEHEAGLAIDLNSLSQNFEQTETYEWLMANCTRFGFILRYEKDTTPITGIAFEPWHYRYVGTNHAKAITDMGLTLDEYVWMMEEEWGVSSSSVMDGSLNGDSSLSSDSQASQSSSQ